MGWPMIKVPGPRESGSWKAGRINIVCFSFTDTYPRRLNNFLWTVRGWPIIHWLSIFWARGGWWRCAGCKRLIGVNESCCDAGNMLSDKERYYHGFCYDRFFTRKNVNQKGERSE